jgi:hypothetical protein
MDLDCDNKGKENIEAVCYYSLCMGGGGDDDDELSGNPTSIVI